MREKATRKTLANGKTAWNAVEKAIAGYDKTALVALIGDLYDFSDKNKHFLHAHFSIGTDPLKPYKKIIYDALNPDVMKNEPIRLAKGKQAISDYTKAVDNPKGTLELMLYFVESGTRFTLEFGDIDENYYLSLERMYRKAIDLLQTFGKESIDEYCNRFERLVVSTKDIGWGYHDSLADIFYEKFPDENEADPLR